MKGATDIDLMEYTGLISIHAPVKGATCYDRPYEAADGEISIHAPVKGATQDKKLHNL